MSLITATLVGKVLATMDQLYLRLTSAVINEHILYLI